MKILKMVFWPLKKLSTKAERLIIVLLSTLIFLYKVCISPFIGNNCRFYPSCSKYFEVSLKEKGLLKGFFLGVKRILKCNPMFPGGIDLVTSDDSKDHK